MTDFKNMLGLCGPSRREAADYFEVREDTVKNWSSGRTSPPDNVVADLAWLWGQIYTVSNGGAGMADLPEWAQARVDALALMKQLNSRPDQGDAPSLVSVVADEMVALKWTEADVAERMEGDYQENIQNLKLALMVPEDRCTLKDEFIAALDGAFGHHPGFFKTIHQMWLESPRG
ncbi:MAG: hypothetical protein GY767_22330 [Shimia sp.]|nr:hypothetical protein [Shimia sp.]